MTHSLALLRRLAVGLPLIALPGAAGLLGCSGSGPCATDTWSGRVSAEQRMRLESSEDSFNACQTTCQEIVANGAIRGPVDAASRVDAGWRSPSGGIYVCDLWESTLVCSYRTICAVGRAPQGLVTPKVVRGGIAAHFAEMAHLEAAAVPAFEDLAEELMLHGAPKTLQRAARRGVEEEGRHAAAVGRLALRYGGEIPEVVRTERQPRTLMALAADNALEGCVREAYGALEAAHQAAHAADPAVRATLQSIAREEAQHALMSLQLDAWARTKLTAREGRTLTALRHEGMAQLSAGLQQERARSVHVLAGVPSATRASGLLSLLG